MENSFEEYSNIGQKFLEAKSGNMFGWRCFKYKNKPFLFFDENSKNAMVFKLDKDSLFDALNLIGVEIFNPGDKGKPMKNWAVIPYRYLHVWEKFALKSYELILKEIEHGK
jgi:hypothetical protein